MDQVLLFLITPNAQETQKARAHLEGQERVMCTLSFLLAFFLSFFVFLLPPSFPPSYLSSPDSAFGLPQIAVNSSHINVHISAFSMHLSTKLSHLPVFLTCGFSFVALTTRFFCPYPANTKWRKMWSKNYHIHNWYNISLSTCSWCLVVFTAAALFHHQCPLTGVTYFLLV